MKPETELPADFQEGKGGAVIARDGMAGSIAYPAHLSEKLGNLAGHDAVVLEPSQQTKLRFFRRSENADPRGKHLGKQFRELAQLQDARIRICGEILFRQHTETHKLHIMLLKTGEIRRGQTLHRPAASIFPSIVERNESIAGTLDEDRCGNQDHCAIIPGDIHETSLGRNAMY